MSSRLFSPPNKHHASPLTLILTLALFFFFFFFFFFTDPGPVNKERKWHVTCRMCCNARPLPRFQTCPLHTLHARTYMDRTQKQGTPRRRHPRSGIFAGRVETENAHAPPPPPSQLFSDDRKKSHPGDHAGNSVWRPGRIVQDGGRRWGVIGWVGGEVEKMDRKGISFFQLASVRQGGAFGYIVGASRRKGRKKRAGVRKGMS
ncbi:hypothetical protein V8C35DRAFT_27530 [Trichoderma chlorosporum]